MTLTKELWCDVVIGTDLERVEGLRQILKYPLKQRDPKGSRFWYLRPDADESEAEETCPIAVGFYSELNDATDAEIKKFLTSIEQQQEIYGHYTSRISEQQPVMYLLLPTKEGTGRIPLVLPNEGGLRQRQIQTFDWNEPELLGRLSRLQQGELPIAAKAMCSVPLVEWVFYEPIKTAEELARSLAEAARQIEQIIPKVYTAEKSDGYLHKLLESFQRELLPTLQLTSTNEKDYSFADIYAQTIAYALFTARVFSYVRDKREGREKETHFDRESAWKQLPETNPFLRRLFQDVSERSPEELGDELIGAIAEIFGILRAAKMDAILSDFHLKMNREDIVIRFYEDFLAAYKPQMRERRGVYYTPEPVVSYMVRSVDEMLKDKLNKPLGLAAPEVMILDPACGTGTFLLWICQLIYQRFQESPEALTKGLTDKSWSSYVKERLLPRVFGFELLMAPYAIAHLKLSLFLEETGYQFDSGKRLGVYLSNTLEDTALKDVEQLSLPGMEELIAREATEGAKVKKQEPIMVVIGNPPYSGHSANNTPWISSLVRDYYKVDGLPLGERNPKWLQDDYVKFIRFAQWRIDRSQKGILAFITNHGFLDNLTFRGMRQQLINSFDSLYVYDLHGNIKKKEKQPNGTPDGRVFDIQQGVAITLAIKGTKKFIAHSNLWGTQEFKYKSLSENSIASKQWSKVKPQSPFYLFISQDSNLLTEYEQGWQIPKIFSVNSVGVVTGQDSKTIAFTQSQAKALAEVHKLPERTVVPILYRPFDQRFIVYDSQVVTRPRLEVMRHMVSGENLGMQFCRQIVSDTWRHILATSLLTDDCHVSNKTRERGYTFPLYLYPETQTERNMGMIRCSNLSKDFLSAITSKLGYTPTPETIFKYIYAIFHSPTYRNRYAEFLKIDFPRVPITNENKLFRQLAAYGEELVALHLMKSPKLNNLITQFVDGEGNRVVDAGHPKFSQGEVVINKKGDHFAGVPETVWNFHVGGYQVCQKWLKDRKGRTLSNEDIQHYQRIVVALQETIRLMQQIDEVISGFPIQ